MSETDPMPRALASAAPFRKPSRLKRAVAWLLFLLVALAAALLLARLVETLRYRSGMAEFRNAPFPASVAIVRDNWGVPTIFGESDTDTAFGLAYAHAEDDFRTLQERLAVVRRQLGALNGADGARADYFSHLIDARGQTEAGLHRLSPEALAMARAYADGLNYFAARHPSEVVRTQLFPVTAEDIIEGFVLVSPFFFGLDGVVGDLVEGRNLDMSSTFGGPGERGSNAFAVAPARMADNATHLISNSHQPWYGVVAWYEARVVSGEGMRFQGVTFPGVPVMLMGHNERLGWTNTVNSPDMVDVYKLELDRDGEGNSYRYGYEWRELERTRVWLRVRFGPLVLPVPRMVERSVHGPVIRNDAGAFAFRYGGMGETRHLDQYYRLTKTKTLEAWREVMAMQAIPGTNFIYADHEGNIGLLYNASLPARDPAIDWSGVLPGDRPELVWETYEPASRIPFLLNPPSGFVFNANNTPLVATDPDDDFTGADFADLVGIEERLTNRAVMAQRLLSADDSLTPDELWAVKMDTTLARDTDQGRALAGTIPHLAPEPRTLMESWDWRFDGEHPADALALHLLHEVWVATYFDVEAPDPAEVAARVPTELRDTYSRLDPPLGEVLRLRRGEADLPLAGAPGVLRAIHSRPDEDGRLVAWNGDSYILWVRWPEPGAEPVAQSIMAHGAAVDDPSSPHHADQAELFARGELKPSPLPRWEERP